MTEWPFRITIWPEVSCMFSENDPRLAVFNHWNIYLPSHQWFPANVHHFPGSSRSHAMVSHKEWWCLQQSAAVLRLYYPLMCRHMASFFVVQSKAVALPKTSQKTLGNWTWAPASLLRCSQCSFCSHEVERVRERTMGGTSWIVESLRLSPWRTLSSGDGSGGASAFSLCACFLFSFEMTNREDCAAAP